MKAYVVEAEALALLDDALPGGGVRGWEACLWKAAVLYCSAQVNALAVEEDISSVDGYFAETEGDADWLSLVDDGGCVELRRSFAPRQSVRDADIEGLVIEGDVCGLGGKIGFHTLPIYIRCSAQLHAASYAVPVALCLVCDTMGVLSNTYVLNSVVDSDADFIFFARTEDVGEVVLVWHAEAHLVSHFTSIDEHGGLDMRSFKEESDVPSFPFTGDVNGSAVGGFAHEVLLRGKEERKFHLSVVAVGLHEGIKVVAGVVEGARPTCVYGYVITQTVGQQ